MNSINKIEKLVLGTVQFGLDYGINNNRGKVPEKEAFKILNMAWGKGLATLDTAASYGNAEEVIGNYIDKNPKDQFNIITKLASNEIHNWRNSLESSLLKLNQQSIDILLFHSFEAYQNAKNENLVKEIIKEKPTLYNKLGVSVYTNAELKNLIDDDFIEVVQLPFNLLDNYALRADILMELKERGKIIHTRSVFLQGLFFKNPAELPEHLSELQEPLKLLQSIAEEVNMTIGQMALLYNLSQAYIDGVLIGVDSREQLETNFSWLESSLSPKQINAINQIRISNLDLLNPSLWKTEE